jgi:hypothetical protein
MLKVRVDQELITKFPTTAMKMKLFPLLVGLSLTILGCSQAAFGALIVEIDEVNGTLVGILHGLNGNGIIGLTLTGPQDGWTVQLPSGFALTSPGPTVELGEPENSGQKNEVLVGTQPQFLTWTSDRPNDTGNPSLPASITIPDAGTINAGLSLVEFDLKLVDKDDGSQKGVPDTSSTAGILILAVFGIVAMSRVCNLKVQTNLPYLRRDPQQP